VREGTEMITKWKVLGAVLAMAMAVSLARAVDVDIIVVPGAGQAAKIAAAPGVRDTWISSTFAAGSTAVSLEDFEGYTPAVNFNAAHLTGAGTFTPSGLPSSGSGTGNVEFSILDAATSPFSGRYNTTPGGDNWLDSNDITELTLAPLNSITSLFFFIGDANDVGGALRLEITTAGGTTTWNFPTAQPNGSLYFVGISDFSPGEITSIRLVQTNTHDGYALDDFGTVSVGQTPEPGTLGLMGLGLVGLMARFRRRPKRQ
jgi:PEP-CTERM motif